MAEYDDKEYLQAVTDVDDVVYRLLDNDIPPRDILDLVQNALDNASEEEKS